MIQKRIFGKFNFGIHKLFTCLLVLILFSSIFLSVIVVSEKENYDNRYDAKLEYTPKSYDFGDVCRGESDYTIFDICNGASPPYESLNFSLSWDCDWVSVSPTDGCLSVFEYETINVVVDTSGLNYGIKTCEINIDSDAGNGVFDLSVNVVSNPPVKPTNPNPSDDSVNVEVNPALSVNVSDVDDDLLSVTFFDASDDSLIDSVENVQSGETVTVEWNNLDYETTYSWYIVVDDTFYETSSDVFSFTTTPAFIFSNINPDDRSMDIPWNIDNLSLNVQDSDGNDNFDWSITTSPDIGSSSGKGSSGDKIECEISSLKSETTYSWTVTVANNRGEKTESVFSFRTMENIAPKMPVALLPSIDALDVSIVCTLNWSCVDPDGDKGLIYDVYFGKTTNPPLLKEDLTQSFFKVTYDLELNTKYYWKIKVTDSFGESSESSVFSFKTSTVPPPPSPDSINISFPRKICLFGFKADITNNGVRAASNINWHVSIKGGIFDRVNASNSGFIDNLNLNETKRISTYEFLNFKTIPFGLGRAEVTLIATDKDGVPVGMNSVGVFLVFRMTIVL